jgi:hypothetical protein
MKHISTFCKIEHMNNLKFGVAHFLLKLWVMNNKFQIATTSLKSKKLNGGWCIILVAKQFFFASPPFNEGNYKLQFVHKNI